MKKKILGALVSVLALAWFVPAVFAQSSGGPSGAGHRMPHDIAFSAVPSATVQSGQNIVKSTLANWVNTPMKRLVCAEAFHSTTGAKTHLGCATLDFGVTGTAMSSNQFDVPLTTLSKGIYRLVYTYQDAGGFWHQMTNLNDNLVQTTVTVI